MKITLYYSSYSNRIFYVRNKKVYTIDGRRTYIDTVTIGLSNAIHKIGEI